MLHDKADPSARAGAFDSTLVAELVKQIKDSRPAFAQAIPEVILEEMSISGLERARQRGLYEAAAGMGYVMLMFELGANFELIEPVAALMRDKDVTGPSRWRFIIHNIAEEQWQQIARARDDRQWYPELFQQKQKSYFLDSELPEDVDRFISQGRKELEIHQDLLSEELALASIDIHESEREALALAVNHFQRMRKNDLLAAGGTLLEVVPRVLEWWVDAGKRESTFVRITALKKTIVSLSCKIIGLELMVQQHAAMRVRQLLNNIDRAASLLGTQQVLLDNGKLYPAQTQNGQKRPARPRTVLQQQVCVTTGEVLMRREDFTLQGPFPLRWCRHYASSDSEISGLGVGWRATGSARLQIQFNQVVLFDEDSRIIYFDLPQVNQGRRHRVEEMILWREDEHTFRLQRSDVTDIFTGSGLFKYISIKVDRNGHAVQFQRNKENRLDSIIDSCGRRYAVSYNSDGLLSAISLCDTKGTPQLPALVYYQFDQERRLVQALDALGQNERYQYEGNLLVKHTHKTGYSYLYEWDGRNAFARCIKTIGQTGSHQRVFEYSTLNRINHVHAEGGKRSYQYNELGMIGKFIERDGRETVYTYDTEARIKSIRDAAGQRVKCFYNIYGDFLSFQNPLGKSTRFYYDAKHRPVRMLAANGGVWLRDYDDKGNITCASNPIGQRTELNYNDRGLLERIVDAAGKQMFMIWENGLLTEYHDASGRVTRYQYDERSRLAKVIDWVGLETRFDYDLTGRILGVHHCDGSEKKFKFDAGSNLLSYTDTEAQTTQFIYHGLSEPMQRIDPNGNWVYYEYDTEQRLVQLRHDRGEHFQLKYDKLGRLIEVNVNGALQKFEYDTMDFVVAWRRPDQSLNVKRNVLGQITAVEKQNATTCEFEYDDIGRMVNAKINGKKRRFLFDIGGQLLEEEYGGSLVRYQYDKTGRRVRTITPAGKEIRCVFDESGALSSVDGQPVYQFKQAHDMPAFPSLRTELLWPVCCLDPHPVESSGWISSSVPHANEFLRPFLDRMRSFYTNDDLFVYEPFQLVDRVAGALPKIVRSDPAGHFYTRFEPEGALDAKAKVEQLVETYLRLKTCNVMLFAD